MAGGKGTALGTFIGALMLAVLKVGMVVINVDSFWQFVVTGIIIIVASYFEFIQQDVAEFILFPIIKKNKGAKFIFPCAFIIIQFILKIY